MDGVETLPITGQEDLLGSGVSLARASALWGSPHAPEQALGPGIRAGQE